MQDLFTFRSVLFFLPYTQYTVHINILFYITFYTTIEVNVHYSLSEKLIYQR